MGKTVLNIIKCEHRARDHNKFHPRRFYSVLFFPSTAARGGEWVRRNEWKIHQMTRLKLKLKTLFFAYAQWKKNNFSILIKFIFSTRRLAHLITVQIGWHSPQTRRHCTDCPINLPPPLVSCVTKRTVPARQQPQLVLSQTRIEEEKSHWIFPTIFRTPKMWHINIC